MGQSDVQFHLPFGVYMTVSVELGGAREKTPARFRQWSESGWSEWRQLTKRVEFLHPGQYQVAPGEGSSEPDEIETYDVHSLVRDRGGAINGMVYKAGKKSLSFPGLNAIFNFH